MNHLARVVKALAPRPNRHRLRRRATRIVVATLLAAVTAPVLTGASGIAAADPAPRPGTVLDATPITANLLPLVPIQARAWKITYATTSASGTPTVVTGTVLVPPTPYNGKRPIVGYAPGTQGMADRCAPSSQLVQGTLDEAAPIGSLLAHGWAVAVTDYPGLGTPGDHTYNIGRANGPAVLDAIRAARNLTQAGLPTDGPLALTGYSEGGGAAGWAAELQPTYAPDLELSAAAIGAVPADLRAEFQYLDNGVFTSAAIMGMTGMMAAYPELRRIEPTITDRGRQIADEIRGTCIYDLPIPAIKSLGMRTRDITTTDLMTDPDASRRLTENLLGQAAPAVPVLIVQGNLDELVPPATVRTLAASWVAQGATVEYNELGPLEHGTIFPFFWARAMSWLEQRLPAA